MPDIDRRTIGFERRFDDINRAHHTGAEAAGGAKQDG